MQHVQLQRYDMNTPWGFRLQGGTDFRGALSVKKVTPGSPVEGTLTAGDAILAISGYDTSKMTHQQASDMIRNAGTTLQMQIEKNVVLTQANAPQVRGKIGRGKFETVQTNYLASNNVNMELKVDT